MTSKPRTQEYDAILVARDFNLHHPLWNPIGYINQEPQAEILMEVMMEANLRTLLPPGMVIFPTANESGGTTIDLVWGTKSLRTPSSSATLLNTPMTMDRITTPLK